MYTQTGKHMRLIISTVFLKLGDFSGSDVHCKSGSISEMLQDRDVTTADH